MKPKVISAELVPTVVSILSLGPRTCADLAPALGIAVRDVGTVMTYCQAHKIAERAGYVNLPTRHGVVLWQLYAGSSETVAKPKPSGPIAPQLVYRSPLAEFLGEPAVGRSALDQRGSRAQQ